VVSDFAKSEFSSAVARRVRTGALSADLAYRAFEHVDKWVAEETEQAWLESSDIALAEGLVRRLELGLRTPDAINLAIALRTGCDLATFDARMADCARALGLPLVEA
jgi:predicted nucleic acid-binding protein